jgi:hypothetical protein
VQVLTRTCREVGVTLASQVVLSKQDVIDACVGLADAERALLAQGAEERASELGELFDRLEDLLFVAGRCWAHQADGCSAGSDFSGSNSSDREFTQ